MAHKYAGAMHARFLPEKIEQRRYGSEIISRNGSEYQHSPYKCCAFDHVY
jgi:hypothetical protein